MIVIFGTFVLNDDVSRHFLNFFEILVFWPVSRVEGQKIVQNEK